MKSGLASWKLLVVACALLLGAAQVATSQSRSHHSRTYPQIEGINLSTVKVKNGKVAQIRVTEHSEVGSRFYDAPIPLIPAQIVKEQSTKVDAVSGATATSYGIMAAVENALKKAAP